ncbi:MAG TPA: hypothetical protein ENH85_01700 [Candidatus Scalindua sp.]|nr:hypothetical protein [Candidatus Scalindua sp.]
MDAEVIEKEISDIKAKISEEKRRGKIKLELFQRLQKELNDGAAQVINWEIQIGALQKALDS